MNLNLLEVENINIQKILLEEYDETDVKYFITGNGDIYIHLTVEGDNIDKIFKSKRPPPLPGNPNHSSLEEICNLYKDIDKFDECIGIVMSYDETCFFLLIREKDTEYKARSLYKYILSEKKMLKMKINGMEKTKDHVLTVFRRESPDILSCSGYISGNQDLDTFYISISSESVIGKASGIYRDYALTQETKLVFYLINNNHQIICCDFEDHLIKDFDVGTNIISWIAALSPTMIIFSYTTTADYVDEDNESTSYYGVIDTTHENMTISELDILEKIDANLIYESDLFGIRDMLISRNMPHDPVSVLRSALYITDSVAIVFHPPSLEDQRRDDIDRVAVSHNGEVHLCRNNDKGVYTLVKISNAEWIKYLSHQEIDRKQASLKRMDLPQYYAFAMDDIEKAVFL